MNRVIIVIPVILLAAGCASSQSKVDAELLTLEGMTCPNLEAEIILAETKARIEAIRTVQLAQGCEIKALPPQQVARKHRRTEPPHWKLDRSALGAQRASQNLDRR